MDDHHVMPYSNGVILDEQDYNDQRRHQQNLLFLLGFILVSSHQHIPRVSRPFRQRLSWDEFIAREVGTNRSDFEQALRMPVDAFEKLCNILHPHLPSNKKMATLQGGLIESKLRAYLTIRFLAGGAIHDIRRQLGCEKSTGYAIVVQVCKAIIMTQELRFKFPQTEEECQKAALGFASISFGEAILNCVSVIDGYLLQMQQPPKQKVGNQQQYFSGHYKMFGINMQAACNHLCRFMFFAIAGPGSMNDNRAIEECSLHSLIDTLPAQYAVIGDAAYTPSKNLTPIYYGVNRENAVCNNFNFFASQLRIRIEMAFGQMQNKWRILEWLMKFSKNIKYIVIAIAHLHNYTINYRIAHGDTTTQEVIPFTKAQPTFSDDHETPLFYNVTGDIDPSIRPQCGHSILHETMAQRIQCVGCVRPIQNSFS